MKRSNTEIKIILDRLKTDEDYYGEFGQQFMSNSNIGTLMNNPMSLRDPQEMVLPFLTGGYFHTAILEPEKLMDNYQHLFLLLHR
jgi:hypothetical protein